jgi:hypothetical protein
MRTAGAQTEKKALINYKPPGGRVRGKCSVLNRMGSYNRLPIYIPAVMLYLLDTYTYTYTNSHRNTAFLVLVLVLLLL